MSTLSDILDFNTAFVQNKEYEPFLTDARPNKRLVVLTCMDTRLVELLPRAMNMRNGDIKLIKNAGAIVSHPFGSVMRSILVAIYALDANEVMVIGHHNCGMSGLECSRILDQAMNRGVTPETIQTLQHAGIDLRTWLSGFASVEEGVRGSVEMVRSHPLLPKGVIVHGLIMSPETGKLDVVIDGYATQKA